MGLTKFGGSDRRGGLGGGGDVYQHPSENSYTVNCDQTYYGYVSGSGEANWEVGVPVGVGSGELGTGGDAVNGKGGGDGRYGG